LWAVTDGALPAGLTLESDGQVHGSPTTVGAYSVEITATNAHGSDVATYTGTVDAIPATAPTITGVTPDDGSLTFEFTAPISTGGAVIIGYDYSLDGGSSWLSGPFGIAASPLTISGLANGTDYSVTLRAVTVAGGGAASGAADGTPRTIAEQPTLDSVAAGDHSLVVEFTPPSDDGGSAIAGYRYSVDGGVTWSASVVATTASPLTIYGLENGQAYLVALRAVSDAGDGGASSTMLGVPVAAPVALPGETDPPELQLGIGDGSENGETVTVFSGPDRAGWTVSTASISLTLAAYDSHARLVAGGGEAYFEGYLGGYVLVSGEGFKPGSTVDVWMFSTPMKLGSLTVTSDGSFSGMVSLPVSLGVGAHTVQVNGVTAGEQTASTSLGVRLGIEPRGLATTGGTVGGALAAPLVCAGLVLLIVGRRRREV
jgi:PKD repeat protein